MLYKTKRRRFLLKRSSHYKLKLKTHKKPKYSRNKPYKLCMPQFFNNLFQKQIQLYDLKHILPEQLDVVISSSNFIYGYDVKQETMTFDQFLNYRGNFNLYLAQQPLYKKLKQKDLEPKLIQKKIDLLNQSQISFTKIKNPFGNINDISSINLWISKGYTDSGWHYDSFDNFLGVSQGTKIVWLTTKVDWKDWVGVYEAQYNHLKRIESKIRGKYVVLRSDEVLFIPQGMFHRVISLDDSIALNVWVEGIDQQKLQPNDYQFRYMLHEKIQDYSLQRVFDEARNTLRSVKNQEFYEKIIVENRYEEIEFSNHRTVKKYSFVQQITIILCLILLKFSSEQFIRFLKRFRNFLPYLNEFSYLIIAYKLDDYSQKDIYDEDFGEFQKKQKEKIEEREELFKELSSHVESLERVKEVQSRWIKRCGAELLVTHL